MSPMSSAPDVSGFHIEMDAWTSPFWKAAAEQRLVVPRCSDCETFRWPPGPFCPKCRSQETEWLSPGQGHVFSFIVVPVVGGATGALARSQVPALIRFPEAGDISMLAAIVDAPIEAIRIDAAVHLDWSQAENTQVPVFRLSADST